MAGKEQPLSAFFQSLVREKPEKPFLVVNLDDIVSKYRKWTQLLPRVRPYYAIKCNDNPIVTGLLASLGTGFDCASINEIESVLNLDVPSSDIIFANPVKSVSFVKYAAQANVNLITFDCESELHKIAKYFPEARLILRLKVDDSHSMFRLGEKFGALLDDVPSLFKLGLSLHLNIVGVAFHVGCECVEPNAYREAISEARQVFDLANEYGYHLKLLDIGGGYPGIIDFEDPEDLFVKAVKVINRSLDIFFPPNKELTIISEPGRYFVQSAFTLFTKIIGKKQVVNHSSSETPMMMYYLNEGIFGTFCASMWEPDLAKPEPVLSDKELRERKCYKSIFWGPTCDSNDCIKRDIMFTEMAFNEMVVFKNMGAYTLPLVTNFNGFDFPDLRYFWTPAIASLLSHLQIWPKLKRILTARKRMSL